MQIAMADRVLDEILDACKSGPEALEKIKGLMEKWERIRNIRCPKCESGDGLVRIESVMSLAYINPTKDESGWEYSGESKVLWDTQDRSSIEESTREFQCTACGTEFDWSREDGYEEED